MRTIVLLALAFALTLSGTAMAQDDQTTVTLPDVTLSVGETATIQARIDCAVDGCAAFSVALSFDPAVIRVDNVRLGRYLSGQILPVENMTDNEAGSVRLAAVVMGDMPTPESDVLFELVVTALAGGDSSLAFTALEIGDMAGNPVAAQAIAGRALVEVGTQGTVLVRRAVDALGLAFDAPAGWTEHTDENFNTSDRAGVFFFQNPADAADINRLPSAPAVVVLRMSGDQGVTTAAELAARMAGGAADDAQTFAGAGYPGARVLVADSTTNGVVYALRLADNDWALVMLVTPVRDELAALDETIAVPIARSITVTNAAPFGPTATPEPTGLVSPTPTATATRRPTPRPTATSAPITLEGARLGEVNPNGPDTVALYAAPDLGANLTGAVITPDTPVLLLAQTSGQWQRVMTFDGTAGWAITDNFVAADNPLLASARSLSGERLVTLNNGVSIYRMAGSNLTASDIATLSDGAAQAIMPAFTEAAGTLEHEADDGFIELARTDPELRDFVAEATFSVPYATTVGDWDIGYLFREYASTDQFRLIVNSDLRWEFGDFRDGDYEVIASGSIFTLLRGVVQTNRLTLVARGNAGHVYLNGDLIAYLDLSNRSEAGKIAVATGLQNGHELDGQSTRCTNFAIWSLDTITGALPNPCFASATGTVNLRSGPGTNFSQSNTLTAQDGAQIVTGRANGSDGFMWWQLGSGRWVRSDVVSTSGSCASLPEK